MKNLVGLLLGFVLLLSACNSFFKIEVLVDNTTDKEMVVVVDGKAHKVAPLSTKRITVVKGEHEIVANMEGEDLFSNTISITREGILNLLEKTYVIHKELYVNESENDSDYLGNVDLAEKVEINGKTYQNVDFTVYEGDVFIPKNWDYSIDEELPLEIDNNGEDFVLVSKIYRLAELEDLWGFNNNTFDFREGSDADLGLFMDSLQNYPIDTLIVIDTLIAN